MSVDFTQERWESVRANYRSWWAGELDRPLLAVSAGGADPRRDPPELPPVAFTSFYDSTVPAELIVDRWDYELSCQRYFGDGFPSVWPNFGAGVGAAFMGAVLENREETVWFHPEQTPDLKDLILADDKSSPWMPRIADIMKAAMERWQGLVQVGMTDLGGAYDILATFRPGEKLLLDLYDDPETIKKLSWDIHTLWWEYFDQLNTVLQPVNPGYTAWTPIYSEIPYYMLQCDFCYMIGPKMFDEFILPELKASSDRLGNAFYHLDGPGQLPHLDSILSIESLKGVQWIPGDGQPGVEDWPEVYRKIRDAGKLIQVFDGQSAHGLEIIDVLADQLGSAEGIIVIGGAPQAEMDRIARILERHGATDGL